MTVKQVSYLNINNLVKPGWLERNLPEFADRESGWGFRRRRLCPSRRFLQLRFPSSNSTNEWNLLKCIQQKLSSYLYQWNIQPKKKWGESERQFCKEQVRLEHFTFINLISIHDAYANIMLSENHKRILHYIDSSVKRTVLVEIKQL